jgi:hypothetical protein
MVTDGIYPCAEAYAARKKVHDERWHKRKQRDVAVERDLEGIAQRKVTAMRAPSGCHGHTVFTMFTI